MVFDRWFGGGLFLIMFLCVKLLRAGLAPNGTVFDGGSIEWFVLLQSGLAPDGVVFSGGGTSSSVPCLGQAWHETEWTSAEAAE